MKLTLELHFTSDITFYGRCGCGWKSDQYVTTDSRYDDERESLFSAWGEHCQEKHRPKGVDAAQQT